MSAKYKRTLWGFSQLSYKAVEVYLGRMSEKGWFIERINERTAIFRRMKPHKLKFCVDLTDFNTYDIDVNHRNSGFDEYRVLCEDSGWRYVTHFAKCVIFCAEEDAEPVPLQMSVEEGTVVGKVLSADLKNSVWGVILGIAALSLALFISVKMNAWYELITGLDIYLVAPIIVIMMIAIAMLADSLYWYAKYRGKMKYDEVVLQDSFMRVRIKSVFYLCGRWLTILCPLLIYLGRIIPWGILSMKEGAYMLSLICMPALIILFALFVYPITMDNMSGPGMAIMCMTVALAGIIIVTCIPLISEKSDRFDDYILTRDDIVRLDDVCSKETINYVRYREGISPLYPQAYTLIQEGDVCRLYIERFKSLSDNLAIYLFSEMVKAKSDSGSGLFASDMQGEWDCDEVLLSPDGRRGLIRKDSIVIYFDLGAHKNVKVDLNGIQMAIRNKLY